MKGAALAAVSVAAATLAGSAFAQTKDAPDRVLKLDEHVTAPASANCTYDGYVRGTVHVRGTDRYVDARLAIDASVRCPDTVMVISESETAPGPLTREELERRLERRATVTNTGSGCQYVPQFNLTDDGKLDSPWVRYLCPSPKQ